jgi:hypothetical protein
MCECKCGDQVPGRTITAGEVGRRSHLINGCYIETPSIIDFLEALGITVVPDPDPEPTNRDKLAGILVESFNSMEFDLEDSFREIAAVLDKHGVTAPNAKGN